MPQRGVVALRQHLGRQFARDAVAGQRQQLVVGDRAPLLVEVLAQPVELDEARPVVELGVEHRRVRAADAQNDACHGVSVQDSFFGIIFCL